MEQISSTSLTTALSTGSDMRSTRRLSHQRFGGNNKTSKWMKKTKRKSQHKMANSSTLYALPPIINRSTWRSTESN